MHLPLQSQVLLLQDIFGCFVCRSISCSLMHVKIHKSLQLSIAYSLPTSYNPTLTIFLPTNLYNEDMYSTGDIKFY